RMIERIDDPAVLATFVLARGMADGCDNLVPIPEFKGQQGRFIELPVVAGVEAMQAPAADFQVQPGAGEKSCEHEAYRPGIGCASLGGLRRFRRCMSGLCRARRAG